MNRHRLLTAALAVTAAVLTLHAGELRNAIGLFADDQPSPSAGASAKDAYRQIEAAVAAGKLTKKEAEAKLQALKQRHAAESKAAKEHGKKEGSSAVGHLQTIWNELQALVAAGQLSKDDAGSVMSTLKEKVRSDGLEPKKVSDKTPAKNAYKQIEAAVRAGKITKEEAQAKLDAMRKAGTVAKKPKSDETKAKGVGKAERATQETEAYFKKVWSKLQEAVAAGKLTKEEAAAKMAEIKKAKLGKK